MALLGAGSAIMVHKTCTAAPPLSSVENAFILSSPIKLFEFGAFFGWHVWKPSTLSTDDSCCTAQETIASAFPKEGPLNWGLYLAPHNQHKAVTGFQHRHGPCVHTETMVPVVASLSSTLANKASLTLYKGSASSFNTWSHMCCFPRKHFTCCISHIRSDSSEEHEARCQAKNHSPFGESPSARCCLVSSLPAGAAETLGLGLCFLCLMAHCELVYILIMLNLCVCI